MTVTASSKVERQGYRAAGVRSPAPLLIPVPEATTDDTVGAVVSICSMPAGLVTAPERLAALPAPSVMVAAL